jgi:excisionase family DNA binding protein
MVMMAATMDIAEKTDRGHVAAEDRCDEHNSGRETYVRLEPGGCVKRAALAGNSTGGDVLPRNYRHLPTLMTIHEVADLLRCSTRTVHRLIDRGEVPTPLKLGTLLRWPQTQIESWLAEGCPRADREAVEV